MDQTVEPPRSPRQPEAEPLVIRITPGGAFATAALAISTAALLFTLGRHYPRQPQPDGGAGPPTTAQRLPAVDYDQLEIDSGTRP